MVIQQLFVLLALHIILPILTLFPQQTLSIGLVDQPQSFLPHKAKTDSEKIVSKMLFRKLFKYEDGQLKEDLVDDWDLDESKKVYVIKLKDNIYWQDRVPITSDDVLYTLTLYPQLREDVDIEKLSDKEIRIELPKPLAILPTMLTFGLEPAHLSNKQSDLSPIGSTSFYVANKVMERDKIQGVILQSFKPDKQYNRIAVRFYDKEDDLLTAYNLGEINAFLSNKEIDAENVNIQSVHYLGRYYTLIFNTSKTKLESADLRTKLVKAVDVESMLQKHYYANSIMAQGPISHSEYTKPEFAVSLYDSTVKLTNEEIELLSPLEIVLPDTEEGRQIESTIRTSWKGLDLNLEFQYLKQDELLEAGKDGDFDVIFVGHEVTPDPDRYPFWHSTQADGGMNFSNLTDLRADKALEEGRKFYSFEERFPHYNIFQDVMRTKSPAIFLYHPGQYFYISKKLEFSMPKIIYYPSDIVQNL